VDVLQHDDGVVHDEADREDEGEERQDVDREPGRGDHCKRADDRDRDRERRDDRGPGAPEENEDDEDYEREGDQDRESDFLDRVADEERGVVGDLDLHPLGHRLSQLREARLDRVGDLERRGARLFDDAEADRGDPLKTDHGALVLRPDLDLRHVHEAHRAVAALREENRPELLRRGQVPPRPDGELARLPLDASGRDLGVLASDRVVYVHDCKAIGGQALRIEPDPHCVAPLAPNDDGAHARHALEPLL
jgi:hypothetical protein